MACGEKPVVIDPDSNPREHCKAIGPYALRALAPFLLPVFGGVERTEALERSDPRASPFKLIWASAGRDAKFRKTSSLRTMIPAFPEERTSFY